jgi:hypothetical protein
MADEQSLAETTVILPMGTKLKAILSISCPFKSELLTSSQSFSYLHSPIASAMQTRIVVQSAPLIYVIQNTLTACFYLLHSPHRRD